MICRMASGSIPKRGRHVNSKRYFALVLTRTLDGRSGQSPVGVHSWVLRCKTRYTLILRDLQLSILQHSEHCALS
jgi:hypothetical protein